jgi:xanthine dehydrogenase accessory factor
VTTDREIARGLLDALDEGLPVVMATVVGTERSVPRHVGAKMLVYSDGRQLGTIGGGEMESRVCAAAHDAMDGGQPTQLDFDLLDPARGDPGLCGGSVSIHLEPFMPQPHLVVIGCGHVGGAVVELAHWLGFRITAIDDRTAVADPARLVDADEILDGPLDECVRKAGIDDRTHVVLLTRNSDIDVEALPVVLASPARSIGVMGSARRWATTRATLAAAGVAESQLDRVVSPIGVDIAAESPAEIALSIMSQLVELRRREPTAEG